MGNRHETNILPPVVVGVDIGKDVFHLVGYSADGAIVFRRKIKRLALSDTFKILAPCIVGMGLASARTSSAGPCANWVISLRSFPRST